MPQILILRRIHLLPGREEAAIRWLKETEAIRARAGQIAQYVVRNLLDPDEYLFFQVWQSRDAYERWRESPERERLAQERQRYLTTEPTRFYEVL